jgi:hypothetical protein
MSDNTAVCIVLCVMMLCLTTCSVSEDLAKKRCEAPAQLGKSAGGGE